MHQAFGHILITESRRLGAAPSYPGAGWAGECFLNIPDSSAGHLIAAERYVEKLVPDFTFLTEWLDFPAGPEEFGLDADFATIGEFLGNRVFEVSRPSELNRPVSNFLLRFTGMLKVTIDDDVELLDGKPTIGLPAWVEFGVAGFDGFRVQVGRSCFEIDCAFRLPRTTPQQFFFHENFIIEAYGLFPITITYFNRYDPDGQAGAPHMGLEVYSWHGGGLELPGGQRLIHATRGVATIVPPRVIYQAKDVLPLRHGDFDADFDVDLRDVRWLQNCFTGAGEQPGGFILDVGCPWLDFDGDSDVDAFDFAQFRAVMNGP